MKQYLDLLEDVLSKGIKREDRTGTGTVSIFGRQLRFDLTKGFPLVTTKKVHFKSAAHELLWFVSGDTNIKYLTDNGVRIWDEWIDKNGDLRQVYGAQWRRWETTGEKIGLIKIKEPDNSLYPVVEDLEVDLEGADDFVNHIFTTTRGLKFQVKKKLFNGKSNSHYLVQFLDTKGITIVGRPQIRTGQVKDPCHRTVVGVGFLGNDAKNLNYDERLYSLWRNMIARCYDKNHPSYSTYGEVGVSVNAQWFCFSDFVQTISQVPFYWQWKENPGEYELDKDYFKSSQYSKKTCMFLSKNDNVGLITQKGIIFEVEGYKFVSQLELARYLNIHPQRISDWVLGKRELPCRSKVSILKPPSGYVYRKIRVIDQLRNTICQIKKDPNSRRHLISAWNVAELDEMALPPCHYAYQFYVADGKLSCICVMRSVDCFLGLPFNIASYALLTHMTAQCTGLEVQDLVFQLGDTHIYKNHFKQVLTQLERDPRTLPFLELNPDIKDIDDFKYEDFQIVGYNPHPAIKGEVSV